MGCSCDNNISTKDETNSDNSSLSNLSKNQKIKNHEQILIISEMLVGENKGNILDYYSVIKTIGEGSFGKVFKVKQKSTGNIFAMKLVSKSTNTHNTNNKNFLNEIYILKKLDHPNILKIYEYFTNEKNWYFILEYVSGGELYDKICEMNYYNENKAAIIMKQILSCISYLHKMNIVHRDIKPENMMLKSKDKDNDLEIKLIDFGTALQLKKKNKKLTEKVGSPYYMAPEVIKGNYSFECDVWSCGIIMYILLIGYPPFDGKNNKNLYKNIQNNKVDFSGSDWSKISKEAKDLILKLLEKNPNNRISAFDALQHPWIKNTNKNIKSNNNFNKISLKNCLQTFSSKQKLHQASVAFIVHHMSNSKIVEELTQIFKELDETGEGLLTINELKKGYKKFFTDDISDKEFDEIMKNIDQDKSGQISIEEFLRATINYENLISEKNLKYAFDYFDKDHSGFLSKDEIKEVLGLIDDSDESNKIVNDIFKEVDLNGDGQISFEEFKIMMENNQKLILKNDNE